MTKLTLAIIFSLLLLTACESQEPATVGVQTPTSTSIAETVSPTASQPVLTPTPEPSASSTCLTSAEPTSERIEEWPDPVRYQELLTDIFPWEVQGFPDNIPDYPEFELSDGLDVPDHVSGDGPITFNLKLRNRYEETVSYGLRGDPGYDFALFSMSGEVVWLHSDDIDVTPGPNSIELEPGERDEFTATWDLTGPGGERVRDGLYYIVAIIYRELVYVELEQQFIHIGEMPSLEDALDVRLSAVSEVQCGEAVTLTLKVTNVTDQIVQLFTGQDVDDYFAFASQEGAERQEIWNWWHDGFIQDYGRAPWIPPGETATFTRIWALQDLAGDHVASGEYELQASFRGSRIVNTSGGDSEMEILWSNIVPLTVIE